MFTLIVIAPWDELTKGNGKSQLHGPMPGCPTTPDLATRRELLRMINPTAAPHLTMLLPQWTSVFDRSFPGKRKTCQTLELSMLRRTRVKRKAAVMATGSLDSGP